MKDSIIVSQKTKDFIIALIELCHKHGIQIENDRDGMVLWDLKKGHPALVLESIEDRTSVFTTPPSQFPNNS